MIKEKRGKDSRPAVFAFLIMFVGVSVWPAFNHRPGGSKGAAHHFTTSVSSSKRRHLSQYSFGLLNTFFYVLMIYQCQQLIMRAFFCKYTDGRAL